MGVCIYTPAFALNAGQKSTHIFLWLVVLSSSDTFFPPSSNRIWTVGYRAGHWTGLHFIHNTSEFLIEWLWLGLSPVNSEQSQITLPDVHASVFLTGWAESGHLDGRVPDACDVRRATGCHRGGSSTGWGGLRGLEESLGRKPHCRTWVNLQPRCLGRKERDPFLLFGLFHKLQ